MGRKCNTQAGAVHSAPQVYDKLKHIMQVGSGGWQGIAGMFQPTLPHSRGMPCCLPHPATSAACTCPTPAQAIYTTSKEAADEYGVSLASGGCLVPALELPTVRMRACLRPCCKHGPPWQ